MSRSTQLSKTPALSRRVLFAGAVGVGAVAAAAVVAPALAPSAAQPEAKPSPARGGGYSLSAHVRRYYQTTRM